MPTRQKTQVVTTGATQQGLSMPTKHVISANSSKLDTAMLQRGMEFKGVTTTLPGAVVPANSNFVKGLENATGSKGLKVFRAGSGGGVFVLDPLRMKRGGGCIMCYRRYILLR